jgi:YbgC/YbaW family acyl-CoA thioester hydrolase
MSTPVRTQFRHMHRLQVRWAEVDLQQVVFNAHYLLYFDTALSGFWRALGLPFMQTLQSLGGDFYVKKADLTWHAPARLDDWIDIGIGVARVGRSSLVLETAMYVQDRLLLSGEMVYVHTDTGLQARPRAIPAPLRELFAAWQAGAAMLHAEAGSWDEVGPAARAIRDAVFVREQGIPVELEWDANDALCRHVVVSNRLGQALACGRLLPDGHIGRVAVLQAVRGSQTGLLLMRALMREAYAAGHREVEISAQLAVERFYRKLGFVACGEPHMEAGLPHLRMRAPALAPA